MRESSVEVAAVDKLQDNDGIYCIKIYKRGWPDRLVLGWGIDPYFMEFKSPVGDLRKLQQYWRAMLQRVGFKVYKVDDVDYALKIYKKHVEDKAVKGKLHDVMNDTEIQKILLEISKR